MAGDYVFEILNDTHDRISFSCGVPSLDAYFHRHAGQDARRHLASVFVVRAPNSISVIGYYTLSNCAVTATELPPAVVKKFGRYPTLPATLLGRLAVDERFKGQKFGQRLLLNALQRGAHMEALLPAWMPCHWSAGMDDLSVQEQAVGRHYDENLRAFETERHQEMSGASRASAIACSRGSACPAAHAV